MRTILMFLVFLVCSYSMFGQVPPKPVLHGPDTVCKGYPQLYYIESLMNADTIIWSVTDPKTSLYRLSMDSVNLNTEFESNTGEIIVYGRNSFGNGEAAIMTVILVEKPSKGSIPAGKETVCSGERSISYTVPTIQNALDYHWKTPWWATIDSVANNGMTIYVDINETVPNNQYGYISVRGASGDCFGDSSSLQITAIKSNIEQLVIKPNPVDGCQGSPVTLTASTFYLNTDSLKYTWKFNDVIMPEYNSKSISWVADTSILKIKCFVHHTQNCITPDTVIGSTNVSISAPSEPGLLTAYNYHVCESDVVTLEVKNNVGNITSWQMNQDGGGWEFLDNTKNPAKIAGLIVGNYNFRANIKNGECDSVTASIDKSVSVTKGPYVGSVDSALVEKAPSKYAGTDTLFLICQGCARYLDTAKYTYRWGYSDKKSVKHYDTLSIVRKQFCIFLNRNDPNTAYYFLEVSSSSGTDNCLLTLEYKPSMDNPLKNSGPALVYPNPTDGNFSVEIRGDYSGSMDARLFNVFGAEVHRCSVYKETPVCYLKFNGLKLSRGVYFIEIKYSGGDSIVKKLIVN